MKQRRALLFPQALTVLTEDEGSRVRLVDFLERRVLSADGVLARDLLAAIDGGEPGPLLASLGRRGGSIARLRGAEALPLTAEAALRLQGFETLFLELTLECTERCVHCYAAAGPERRERLSRETCLEVLEDAAALGFRRVQFTGGDALLVPHLEDLLAAARALGFEMREVFTNGLLLDEARLASLAERGASFAFSLYAADPAVHDAITRVPGSHARTCDAIRRACARDLEVRVAVVELEQNAGHAEAAAASGRGATRRRRSRRRLRSRSRRRKGAPARRPGFAGSSASPGTGRSIPACSTGRTGSAGSPTGAFATSWRRRSCRRAASRPRSSCARCGAGCSV